MIAASFLAKKVAGVSAFLLWNYRSFAIDTIMTFETQHPSFLEKIHLAEETKEEA
jgi:hypothetical protein